MENDNKKTGAKESVANQLSKALNDADMYKTDGVTKAEELDMAK